jgi:hypothetical protein
MVIATLARDPQRRLIAPGHHIPISAGEEMMIDGRGWVRTSDLSRVKSDKKVDNSQEMPGKPEDPGGGG